MKHFNPKELAQEFVLRAQSKSNHELERVRQMESRNRATKKEQAEQDEQFDDMVMLALASSEDVGAFRQRLDDLEQKAISRILQLQHQLDQQILVRQTALERAYVLPDGRRVFPAADGSAVFFEDGLEVDPQIITPSQIGSEYLTAQELGIEDNAIEDIRNKLGEAVIFHEKIEDLQNRSDRNEMTNDELKSFESELDSLEIESLALDNQSVEHAPSNAIDNSEQAEVSIKPLSLPGQ